MAAILNLAAILDFLIWVVWHISDQKCQIQLKTISFSIYRHHIFADRLIYMTFWLKMAAILKSAPNGLKMRLDIWQQVESGTLECY